MTYESVIVKYDLHLELFFFIDAAHMALDPDRWALGLVLRCLLVFLLAILFVFTVGERWLMLLVIVGVMVVLLVHVFGKGVW